MVNSNDKWLGRGEPNFPARLFEFHAAGVRGGTAGLDDTVADHGTRGLDRLRLRIARIEDSPRSRVAAHVTQLTPRLKDSVSLESK